MQKFTTNAFVPADCARDVVDVTTNLIAKGRKLVDERNFRGEKSVGSVLREFRGFERSDYKRRFDQVKRTIKVFHDRDCFFVSAADDDTIRSHEVVYRGALAQKLRIRNDTDRKSTRLNSSHGYISY